LRRDIDRREPSARDPQNTPSSTSCHCARTAMLATPRANSVTTTRTAKTELAHGRRLASFESCRPGTGNRRGSPLRAVSFRSGMGGGKNDRVPRTDDRRQIPADTMLS
jgi:hypothetical protein